MNDGNLTTTINGVNDRGQLVGFYVDANGNTDGFLANPASPEAFTTSAVTINLHLQAMPEGTVSLDKGVGGDLRATVDAFGLTPGSSHTVELVSRDSFAQVLGTLTANSVGQADMTLDSRVKDMWALGSRVEILNGTAGDPVSAEPIAETVRFGGILTGYQLRAVEVGPNGQNYGTPQGTAAISYNPAAQTVTVTVNASGLTPGAHAAHIHDGSCMSQGPVQYMLMDYVANGQGQIVNQSRTVSVTGLTGPVTAAGWYLNLHQGNSNNILANGQPTINFRPLLCSNI
jgi:CHRD domain